LFAALKVYEFDLEIFLRMWRYVYFRGISIGAALRAASHPGTMESVSSQKYEPSSVWGYVEVLTGL
jgi:hypothetical protein